MEFVIITGLSGSGKSQTVNVLEDAGFFCIDNMPPQLIPKFAEICRENGTIDKIALVTDIRGGSLFLNLQEHIDQLREDNINAKILFVSADHDEIKRRYKETRRKHPLLDIADGDIDKAIEAETDILTPIRQSADYFIDTTHMNTTNLREAVRNLFVEAVVLVTTAITMWILIHAPDGTLYLFTLGERLPMTLRIDGLATFFGAIVSLLWPLASLYTFEYMRHEERVNTFLAFYTITYGVTLGVAFAGNIITMYLFYEALTLVTLPLVMHTMTPAAKKAARKYLYYMIGGTAFAFIGIVFYALFSYDIEFAYGGHLALYRVGQKNVVYLV